MNSNHLGSRLLSVKPLLSSDSRINNSMLSELLCTRSPVGALLEISNGGYLQHPSLRETAHLKHCSHWRRGCDTALPRDSSRCWNSQWGGPPPGTSVHSGKWQKHPLSTAEKLMRMERENVQKHSVMPEVVQAPGRPVYSWGWLRGIGRWQVLPMESRTTDRNSNHVKRKPRVLQKRKKKSPSILLILPAKLTTVTDEYCLSVSLFCENSLCIIFTCFSPQKNISFSSLQLSGPPGIKSLADVSR